MITETDDGILIDIKVVPNSSKNDIITESDVVKIKVTAQPVENKANKALIEVISKNLKVPKTSISVVRGHTSKTKTLFIKVNDIDKRKEIISKLAI